MSDLITGEIIGAAIEVHKTLGHGLLESIYEKALCHELELRGIKFQREVEFDITYKDKVIESEKINLVVQDEVAVEIISRIKSPNAATSIIVSYLTAVGLQRGMVFDFAARRLIDGVKRIVI